MHKCKHSQQKTTGYRYPKPSAHDASPMNNSERMRREVERRVLKAHKRNDCERQLAVYVKHGNVRTLAGFVNDYGCVMWWHDVTTSGNVGRPIAIHDMTTKTLNEFCGIVSSMVNVHAYAQRF